VFGIAVIITLVGIAWAFENWRAERHWNRVRTGLVERGVALDWASYVPAEVPNEDNFGALPFWERHFQAPNYGGDMRRLMALPPLAKKKEEARRSLNNTLPVPLEDFVEAFTLSTNWPGYKAIGIPEVDVLSAFVRMEPTLRMLREGLDRKHRVFPVEFEGGYRTVLPHLNTLVELQRTLDLQTRALLQADQKARAFESARFSTRLASVLESEPYAVSQAVMRRQSRLAIHGVWLGIDRGAWTAEQLAEFQRQIEGWDFIALTMRSLQAERAQANRYFDLGVGDSSAFFQAYLAAINSYDLGNPYYTIPRFLMRENQCRYNAGMDQWIQALASQTLEYPSSEEGASYNFMGLQADGTSAPLDLAAAELSPQSPYNVFARAFIPTPEPLVRDLLSTTAMARVASVACALERFRLARGEYPSDLQSLVPQWIRVLPVDPLDRKAFRYELNDGKTYRLQGSRPDWVWGQAWTYARDR
jgi:hypothetical protein